MPQQPPDASELVPEIGNYVGVSVLEHKIKPAFYLRWTLNVMSEIRARVVERRDGGQEIVFRQSDQTGASGGGGSTPGTLPTFAASIRNIGQPANDWISIGPFDRPTLYEISAGSGIGMSIDCFRYTGGYFFRLYVNNQNNRYDALVAHVAFLTTKAVMQLIALRRTDEFVLNPLYIIGPSPPAAQPDFDPRGRDTL